MICSSDDFCLVSKLQDYQNIFDIQKGSQNEFEDTSQSKVVKET